MLATQYVVIEAFNSTSRYLDGRLNIDNNFFDSMVYQIYLSEFQLNETSVLDTETLILELRSSISDGFVTTTISMNEVILTLMRLIFHCFYFST